MAIDRDGRVLKALRDVFESGSLAGLSDRELLERATRRGEPGAEAAFSCLVGRHGPMVLRACRARLPDPNDAEDAFQRVFCLLATRARSLWVRDSLGPWLLQVALRVASGTRAEASRRRLFERRYAERSPRVVPPDRGPDDLGPMLLDEVGRLPDRDRSVVVLCDLEGLTHEEAAHRLGWPIGTVKSRQSRARDRLRRRLLLRGVAPGAVGSVLSLLSAKAARASVPRPLLERAVHAASQATAGAASASVAGILSGAFTMMKTHRIASVAAGLLLVGAAAVGAAAIGRQDDAAPRTGGSARIDAREADFPQETPSRVDRPQDVDQDNARRPAPTPETISLIVTGRAADGEGAPVEGATVLVLAGDAVRGRATTGPDGSYRAEAIGVPVHAPPSPRPENYPFGSFRVVATCPGFGVAWHQTESMYAVDIPEPPEVPYHHFLGDEVTMDLTFRREETLRGRILDEDGNPLEGAELAVWGVELFNDEGEERGTTFGGPWDVFPGGLGGASTDADGRFRIDGLPTEAICRIKLLYPGQDTSGIMSFIAATMDTGVRRDEDAARLVNSEVLTGDFTLRLPSPVKIPIRVVDDSAGPIEGTQVGLAWPPIGIHLHFTSSDISDSDGYATLVLPPGSYSGLWAHPPEDSPYLDGEQKPLIVGPEPPERPIELRMEQGSELIIDAIDAETGKPRPGTRFELVTADGHTTVDRPEPPRAARASLVADAGGRVRAILPAEPDRVFWARFVEDPLPSRIAFGEAPLSEEPRFEVESPQSEPFALRAGETVRLMFEIRRIED